MRARRDARDISPTALAWLEATLKKSTADYLWLAGHYPIYDPKSVDPRKRSAFVPLMQVQSGYNRPCAHQYVGKYQSCMVENGCCENGGRKRQTASKRNACAAPRVRTTKTTGADIGSLIVGNFQAAATVVLLLRRKGCPSLPPEPPDAPPSGGGGTYFCFAGMLLWAPRYL